MSVGTAIFFSEMILQMKPGVVLKSTRRGKKYMILHKNKLYHWGATGYSQYKDRTPLRLYSKMDNNDPARRRSFWKRQTGKSSKREALRYAKSRGHWSKYFSIKFLW